jgi:hypothetical protein
MSGSTVAFGIAGLAVGLAAATLAGTALRGSTRPDSPELFEAVAAQDRTLEALARNQRQAARALEVAGRQGRPVGESQPVPTVSANGAAKATGGPSAVVAPPDPAVEAENRLHIEKARGVLAAALGEGRWTDEARGRFREQLAAMSDDTVRHQVVSELIIAINSQKLRLEGQQVELF